MLAIYKTSQFKKDVKKLVKSGNKNMEKLKIVIIKLIKEEELEAKYKNHYLMGNWNKHFECHIEPDWLLIYKIENKDLILVRTGSHSMLFR